MKIIPMITTLLLLMAYFVCVPLTWGQTPSKKLSHEVYDSWKSLPIAQRQLSANGQWGLYVAKPLEGDSQLFLHFLPQASPNPIIFERAEAGIFDPQSTFCVFRIAPPLDSLKAQRRRKLKPEQLYKDTLGIWDLNQKTLVKIPRLKNFKVTEKNTAFVACLLEPDEPALPKARPKQDSTKKATEIAPAEPKDLDEAKKMIQELQTKLEAKNAKPAQKSPKKEGKETGSKLLIRHLPSAKQDTFLFVTEFAFNKNGNKLAFATTGDDKKLKSGVYVLDLPTQKMLCVLEKVGKFKNLMLDEQGKQLAFLADLDTTQQHKKELIKHHDLYYWAENQSQALLLAERKTAGIPTNYMLNEHISPFFAKNGSRLFFATNPIPVVGDTTRLPEEVVNVDIWHWQDGKIQTQQNAELANERKRGYWATIALKQPYKVQQIASPAIPTWYMPNEGNADFAIGVSNKDSETAFTWQGFYEYDIFWFSLKDGTQRQILKKIRTIPQISPQGKYLFWYSAPDSAWLSYHIESAKMYNLTRNLPTSFYDDEHDMPDLPDPFGAAGWLENDALLLVYDKYDIWALHPENAQPAKNLTQIGKSQNLRFRNIRLDREERFFNPKQTLYLQAFQYQTRKSGFYTLALQTPNSKPEKRLLGAFQVAGLMKAQNADRFWFTKETFKEFGDLYTTTANFENIARVSQANPQQQQYAWGSVELVSWLAPNGETLQGLLYKPEGIEKGKKYPMITYFYERLSQNLHQYIMPEPSRSTIRTPMFTSNDYVVFMPDIPYTKGEPGKNAYDAIMSGVLAMTTKHDFIDTKRLAIQGQSWGGYQVAYLVTQTSLFKCAMAGAPVANMTSAYGGIRYGTGVSRIFQYEKGQSRIGGSLWEKPQEYIQNSPLFALHKVTTPLLIMHNDKDGAVPFTQGIELFMGLRRLQKPVWMLTYNGEDHNLIETKNRKDLSIRMHQFFDYYLKDAPMPYWMKHGVPATEKGILMRYEAITK